MFTGTAGFNNGLRCALLSLTGTLVTGSMILGQQTADPPWPDARNPQAKGTLVAIPGEIKAKHKAKADDCLDSDHRGEAVKMEVYRVKAQPLLLAVQGRGFCFCSPTGNCAFWLELGKRGHYRTVLETDMVQRFGFIKSKTNGLPDLVAWSHGSATESGGRLFQFNGDHYVDICSWNEKYELEQPLRVGGNHGARN